MSYLTEEMSRPLKLHLSDLESIRAVVDSKLKELKVNFSEVAPYEMEENKAAKRAICDLLKLTIGYIEPEEALSICQSLYGSSMFPGPPAAKSSDVLEQEQSAPRINEESEESRQ
jgi:hypothetical protein